MTDESLDPDTLEAYRRQEDDEIKSNLPPRWEFQRFIPNKRAPCLDPFELVDSEDFL